MNAGAAEMLDNRVTERLAGRLAGRVQSLNAPAAAQVISWMDLVELCREMDESLNEFGSPSEEALAMHEAITSLAVGCGTWLLRQIRIGTVDISPSGQTLETLAASLELLHIIQRSRHPLFSPSEIDSVRKRVFDGAT